MIPVEEFNVIVDRLRELGFADADIEWSESIEPPADPDYFALEAIFVICNSGMKNTVARGIYNRVRDALLDGKSAATAFGHVGKTAAMDKIWRDRVELLDQYLAAGDKIEWCGALPWIGPITKYHLAKNFGINVAKPDRHIERLAALHQTTSQDLCLDLAAKTGYRAATIDVLLWRACAEGVIHSWTGVLGPWPRVVPGAGEDCQGPLVTESA
jgi:hypothetical protein